jgi:hypothetical protein
MISDCVIVRCVIFVNFECNCNQNVCECWLMRTESLLVYCMNEKSSSRGGKSSQQHVRLLLIFSVMNILPSNNNILQLPNPHVLLSGSSINLLLCFDVVFCLPCRCILLLFV